MPWNAVSRPRTVVPLPLWNEESMEIVEMSPPALRANIGLQSFMVVADGE